MDYLRSKGIKEKKYNSLFVGETNVTLAPFSKISRLSIEDACFFIGGEDRIGDMRGFALEFLDKYKGGLPKLPGSDQETIMNLLSVWMIIGGLSLMLTLYEVICKRREIAVRILSGESLHAIFFHSCIFDIGLFTSAFFLIPLVLRSVSDTWFKFSWVGLFFAVFLVANTLINTLLLRINFKREFSRSGNGNTLLRANYALKIFAAMLAVVALSSNWIIFQQGYNIYKQKEFFRENRSYAYYIINYKESGGDGEMEDDTTLVNQMFYQRFSDRSLLYADLSANFDSPWPVIFVNRPSIRQISRENPAIASVVRNLSDKTCSILLPLNIQTDSREAFVAEDICNAYFGELMDSGPEYLQYKPDIDIVGIHEDNQNRSILYKNPILIYNNLDLKPDESDQGFDLYYAYDTMFDIPEAEWNDFIRSHDLEDQIIVKSNVWDVYTHHWQMIYKSLRITVALSVLLLLLELSLIFFILRLEYRFHAVEMAVKKVQGYSIVERNKRIIRITVVSSILGTLCALALKTALGVSGAIPILVIGSLMLALEMLYIVRRAGAIEKKSMATILKGENV